MKPVTTKFLLCCCDGWASALGSISPVWHQAGAVDNISQVVILEVFSFTTVHPFSFITALTCFAVLHGCDLLCKSNLLLAQSTGLCKLSSVLMRTKFALFHLQQSLL